VSISEKTAKMLWGNSASRCAICKKYLYLSETETDDPSLIGDMAHIVGHKPKAARHRSDYPTDKLHLSPNLVLLCKCHHKEIDDRPGEYTEDKVLKIKATHEEWVRTTLDVDYNKLRHEIELCECVDAWEGLFNLKEWDAWSSWLVYSGEPSMGKDTYESLQNFNQYILGKIWPEGYEGVITAFKNLRLVINDYLAVFMRHAETQEDNYYTPKFYHIDQWDEVKYNRLFDVFDKHVRLLENLFFELCRAANYLIVKIRSDLISGYRSSEGMLLFTRGGTINEPLVDKTIRLEYSQDNIEKGFYKGLHWFEKNAAKERNFSVAMSELDDEIAKL
jgi:hypothetical protein